MKPEDDQNNWQQPPATPSQAPYAVPTVSQPAEQGVVPQPTYAPGGVSTPVAPTSMSGDSPINPTLNATPAQALNQNPTPVTAPVQPTTSQAGVPDGAASALAQDSEPTAAVTQSVEPVSQPEAQQQDELEEGSSDATPNQPNDSDGTNDAGDDSSVLLRWQGSEYLTHDRGMSWYVVMVVVVLVLVALAVFVLKSVTFAILVPVMAVALLIYVHRTPELLNYTLSHKGLHMNDKIYTYDRFKSFGVVQHGNVNSIVLVPRKRFQIGQTVYFPAEIGEQLVDMLAARLPMKEVKPDAIDKLIMRLRI